MDVVTSEYRPDVAELKLQIEGMRAKLNEYKRFRAQYQANLRLLEEQADRMARVLRENRKLRIAISEIALARPGTSTVKYLAKFAQKVLGGLGYKLTDAETFVSRFF